LHTIIPGMATRNGRAVLAFGVMGGQYQAMGHAHLISNLVDFEMSLQEAVDCPRVFANADGTVDVERGIPAETVAGLAARGHRTTIVDKPIGGAQAIAIEWEAGVLAGASDPRKDGSALGY
ncbi:MAG: gamma-glutamyltransferase, partial [Thermomicrobiales bacterium]|nr:gamma-glutamyltransferase [Thermomicrobiales bacterium]